MTFVIYYNLVSFPILDKHSELAINKKGRIEYRYRVIKAYRTPKNFSSFICSAASEINAEDYLLICTVVPKVRASVPHSYAKPPSISESLSTLSMHLADNAEYDPEFGMGDHMFRDLAQLRSPATIWWSITNASVLGVKKSRGSL